MKNIAIQLGYVNETSIFKDTIDAFRADKSLYFDENADVLEVYKQSIETIKSKLPKVFEEEILTEKNLNVDIKEAEIAALAYYSPGSADGRRKGAFYVNR